MTVSPLFALRLGAALTYKKHYRTKDKACQGLDTLTGSAFW